ncbi:MAG: PaaI family thioesterase [Rhodobacteraceae bacterium]|nr:PaaI family thioesterase [Paracoccaceae bacterium]
MSDKPATGLAALEFLQSKSGLEIMRAMMAGQLPHPPIAGRLDYRLKQVEPGMVIFEGRASEEFTNPMGTMHGGWYGTLLDSAMACAVTSLADKSTHFTTLEYKVNLTRPFPLGETATATGRVLHFGRRTAYAEGKLTDATDRVYAYSTTTCIRV